MKKHKRRNDFYATNHKGCSITLLMRRAWWANSKGYPKHNGYCVDPAYTNSEKYQAEVKAWYDALDEKAQNFLGPLYERFANPLFPKR